MIAEYTMNYLSLAVVTVFSTTTPQDNEWSRS